MIRNGAFEWHILVEKRQNSVVVMDNEHLLACIYGGYCTLTRVIRYIYYLADFYVGLVCLQLSSNMT